MTFWAVAQTESQRERTAQRFLEQEGFETYLPIIQAANKRTIPLFPTYLFVRIVNRWYSIDNTIGVLQLLLSGDLPAKLRDDVIAELKRKERNGVVYLPKPRGLQLGDKVRILRGSFVDHIGLYDGMTGHERRVVLLELLGRKVRVELPNSQYLRLI